MSKTLEYTGTFNPELLYDELLAAFPQYVGVPPAPNLLNLFLSGVAPAMSLRVSVPDNADEAALDAIVAAHNPALPAPSAVGEQLANDARVAFRNLPNYATWTPQEAYDNTFSAIFSGDPIETINANIDAVPFTATGMRNSLKAMAAEIVTIRRILATVVKMLAWLRDVVIRTR